MKKLIPVILLLSILTFTACQNSNNESSNYEAYLFDNTCKVDDFCYVTDGDGHDIEILISYKKNGYGFGYDHNDNEIEFYYDQE